jgi:uncharacterized protein YhbP (UPF0306 family)
MPIVRSNRPVAPARIQEEARLLLDASALCAIATRSPRCRAHVNTAYFAWDDALDIVWLSDPDARHSRNLRANPTAAIAVYDSSQVWGEPDRGIQLFGSAREVQARAAREAESIYARRFPSAGEDLSSYRFYRLHPRRLKLFDEAVLGAGVFVTASITRSGGVAWERTEISSPVQNGS